MTQQSKSPYRRGARQGILFGMYLTAMFVLSIYSGSIALLGLLFLILIIGVPFVIHRMLRESYVADGGYTTFSSLWMQGIMIFACGALLSTLVALIYFKLINPTYISDQLQGIVDAYNTTKAEALQQYAQTAKLMLENKAVPSAGTWVMAMFWFIIFTGSLLSSVISAIVRSHKVKKRPISPQVEGDAQNT